MDGTGSNWQQCMLLAATDSNGCCQQQLTAMDGASSNWQQWMLLAATDSNGCCCQKLTAMDGAGRNWQQWTLLAATDSNWCCWQKLTAMDVAGSQAGRPSSRKLRSVRCRGGEEESDDDGDGWWWCVMVRVVVTMCDGATWLTRQTIRVCAWVRDPLLPPPPHFSSFPHLSTLSWNTPLTPPPL